MFDKLMQVIKELVKKEVQRSGVTPDPITATVRFGTVSNITSGIKVTLDGEDAASGRSYPRLSSYTPAVGHRVMLVRDRGGVWVIMGQVVSV